MGTTRNILHLYNMFFLMSFVQMLRHSREYYFVFIKKKKKKNPPPPKKKEKLKKGNAKEYRESKQYHTVGPVSKSNKKIIKSETKSTPLYTNTQPFTFLA